MNDVSECLWINDSHKTGDIRFIVESNANFFQEFTELRTCQIALLFSIEELKAFPKRDFPLVDHFANVFNDAFFKLGNRIGTSFSKHAYVIVIVLGSICIRSV